MSRNAKIILFVRVLLFVALGILFILKGLEMEITTMKALFLVIGAADFVYAALLAKPFFCKKDEEE